MHFVNRIALAAVFAFVSSAAVAQQKVEIPKDEKSFLERIHHANQMEIQLGQKAQSKASNPQVKEYAQRMVTEHQQLDEQVMAFARQNKLTLSEPKPMNEKERKVMGAHKAHSEMFEAIEGKVFDSVYMAHMVSDHDKVLLKMQAGLQQFPKLGSLINPAIPKVSEHRDQAYRILGTLKPEMQPGVGGSGTKPESDPSKSGTYNR